MKLIILRGLPGSGKTELSNRLASELGAVVVHVDSLKLDIRQEFPGMSRSEIREKAYGRTIQKLKELKENDVSIVICEELMCDATFVNRLEGFCRDYRVESSWLRIDRSIEKLLELENSQERSSREVRNSEENLEKLDQEIKAIKIPEEVVIDNNGEWTETLTEIKRSLNNDARREPAGEIKMI